MAIVLGEIQWGVQRRVDLADPMEIHHVNRGTHTWKEKKLKYNPNIELTSQFSENSGSSTHRTLSWVYTWVYFENHRIGKFYKDSYILIQQIFYKEKQRGLGEPTDLRRLRDMLTDSRNIISTENKSTIIFHLLL